MKLFYVLSVTCFGLGLAEVYESSASASLNKFALNFLVKISDLASKDLNVAISPLTIWTAMSVLNEGARQNTSMEIEKVLGIPSNNLKTREDFRLRQRDIIQNIQQTSAGVTLDLVNSLFVSKELTLNKTYSELVKQVYNVLVDSVDFRNASAAANYINDALSKATRGRLRNIISKENIQSAGLFITSAVFFKGFWDKKFDVSRTVEKPFHNDDGKVIGTVQMMTNYGNFPYGPVLNSEADAVEIPYLGLRMSMIVFLPGKHVRLSTVLSSLSQASIPSILKTLQEYRNEFPEDEVVIRLPKFKISSAWLLNSILHNMGIHDAFDVDKANLKGMAPQDLFVSSVIHQAEIEVDEEGTVGSAVTVVEVTNRITPGIFNANKPFAFVIFDKVTQSVVFAGSVSHPDINKS